MERGAYVFENPDLEKALEKDFDKPRDAVQNEHRAQQKEAQRVTGFHGKKG